MSKKILANIFTDEMVMQRDRAAKVWGFAEAGTIVEVKLLKQGEKEDSAEVYEATANDEGAWEVALQPKTAGGPYNMIASSDNARQVIMDILFGDVWILSGQSNMQLPIERVFRMYPGEIEGSANNQIRHIVVPEVYDFHGRLDDIGESLWHGASPEHTGAFSALGYFFGKKLYEKLNVPIGLVLTAIGGTPVEAWLSLESLEKFPEALDLNKIFQDDDFIERTKKEEEERNNVWYGNMDAMDIGLSEKWYDPSFDDSHWHPIHIQDPWDVRSDMRECGSIWFRKEVEIPAELAGKPLSIRLGCVIDADFVYINGEMVGTTGYQYPPRDYLIPNGLKEGKNTIALRIIAMNGTGGFVADKPYQLWWDENTQISLDDDWKYRRAYVCEPAPPVTFFHYKPAGLYNGMIAPIQNFAMKGILWYQGESNAGSTDPSVIDAYGDKMKELIASWRSQWNELDAPFYMVQLTNWAPKGREINWPIFRKGQEAPLALPHTGMAVTYDVGEYNDLHPLNKKDIGERLALCAFAETYGMDVVASGPRLKEVKKEGNRLLLQFDSIGSGLTTGRGKDILGGFSYAIGTMEFPTYGEIQGDTVVLSAPKIEEATEVSYAWADDPYEANLYNKEGLPAVPFREAIN